MSDLTPLFRQCVSIVEAATKEVTNEKEQHSKSTKKPNELPSSKVNEQFKINDTFLKECLEFRVLLSKLDQFVTEVRTYYLEVQDTTSRPDSLSIEDKNKIDEDFQAEIQQLFKKLKLLQNYERERQNRANSTIKARSAGSGWMGSIFGSGNDEEDDWVLFQATTSTHRTQVLKSLNNLTNNVNKKFEKMQIKRYQRERQLNLLNFQNLGEHEYDLDDFNVPSEEPYVINTSNIPPEELESMDRAGSPASGLLLSQEQVQSLDAENQEFLTLKTNQFQQVEKLRGSMMDIVKLQAELTFQLESQSEQIENLLDNQGQIELDVKMGNKSLTNATSRNKTGSRIIITTSIVVALLILFLDYIT
ncbi:syntaxin Ufe1p [[Candida] railenensis]|uniref:Syntaxin Ufe1p n=1 Tax=[Candida] railenensis TaxID=45579 RepID=A0A9P0QV46_9ASCO|nr:syntaxin Ufe1p [[Candida] railenensis]